MKNPQFKLGKIKNIDETESKEFQKISSNIVFKELLPIIQQLNNANYKNEELKQHLRRYLIIRLVTILEVYFTKWVVRLIDLYKLPYSNMFENPNINIPISRLQEIKKDQISEGKIVATSFNMQNISEINHVFSKLVTPNFLERVKEGKIHREGNKKEKNQFVANWDMFLNIFKIRNDNIHSLHYHVKYSDEELNQIINASQFFIMFVDLTIGQKLFFTKTELLKKHDEFIYKFLENKLRILSIDRR
ncbi:MAG: hypothetical protein OEL77_02900 [Nitrosopumilus sp.]|nr:hypothetical protein [Nitrosopumilus sp.]MDH3384943.1 hypothetical protein [Nitrosopumilus sp.]